MKERLSISMITNMASYVISILISMWLTPFIIKSLGADAYGFIPLTQQLISYISVITIALDSMCGRFFTYALKSGDKDAAEGYFNTSLVSYILLSLIVFIIIIIIAIFINKIINVPERLLFDVRISLFIYGIIFIITMIGSSFAIAMFSENRLDINGALSSINTIIRSLFIVFLLMVFAPRMWFVSLGTLIAAILLLLQNIYYFRKLLPGIGVNIKTFSFEKLKEILSTGIWSTVNYIGAVLFLQIDLLVANWALGARRAGEYSAILQLSSLLRGFVSTITVVFVPTMIALYAKQDLEGLVNYSNKSIRITGLMLALPVGLASGLGGVLITLWLGSGFKGYGFLFFLMTIHLSVNLSVQPLFGIFSATKQVKIPAIVTLIMGIFNFVLAILLSIKLRMGAYGIVIAAMIVLTMKNLIFTPIYSARITGQTEGAYYKGILTPVIGVGSIASLSFIAQKFIKIESVFQLFTVSIIISIIYIIAVYCFVLDKNDKKKLKSKIYNKFNFAYEGGEN